MNSPESSKAEDTKDVRFSPPAVSLPEGGGAMNRALASEANRTDASRSVNRYLKRVKYGNRASRLIEPDLSAAEK